MREVRAMNREGRRNQVLMAFAIQIQRGFGNTMTAYDIARKIDLRPTSPNFRAILKAMVDDGLLIKIEDEKSPKIVNGNKPQLYVPAKEIKPVKRHVSVRANGKQVGQLELF